MKIVVRSVEIAIAATVVVAIVIGVCFHRNHIFRFHCYSTLFYRVLFPLFFHSSIDCGCGCGEGCLSSTVHILLLLASFHTECYRFLPILRRVSPSHAITILYLCSDQSTRYSCVLTGDFVLDFFHEEQHTHTHKQTEWANVSLPHLVATIRPSVRSHSTPQRFSFSFHSPYAHTE